MVDFNDFGDAAFTVQAIILMLMRIEAPIAARVALRLHGER
jgi:hypothetical protein